MNRRYYLIESGFDSFFFILYFFVLLLAAVWFAFFYMPSDSPINQKIDKKIDLNGAVVFWQDGILIRPILRETDSHLTHAAIILDGYVYEAVPPAVRKASLADYIEEMKAKSQKRSMQKRGFTWFIMRPITPYTPNEVQAMIKHAESQLGRPYMLRGWNKKLVKGIFCSQLVSDILGQGGQIKSDSFRESPGSLHKKLEGIYQ